MGLDRPHHSLGSWAWALEVGGFSRSGCHRLWARMPIQFRNQQAERRSSGDHGSIWDSWPIAFSGCPRGPRVFLRLGARGTQRLRGLLRLALEPECLENPTATAREDSPHGADSIRDTQAVCGFRCWASKHTPFFHTIRTMVAIFLAKVSRAMAGRMPLANKAA